MDLISRLALLNIGLATLLLSLGYALQGLWRWVAALLLVSGLGVIGHWRNWRRAPSIALVGVVALAAMGFWWELNGGLLLIGTVAALAAWELGHFAQRLQSAGAIEHARELQRQHLRRLGIVSGLGLLLGGAALSLSVKLSFGVALLLGLLAALGLSPLIRFLRRESN